jgi:hypothetical protein
MTTDQRTDHGLEDLLKRAFADDLPADVEAGMRRKIARFRAEMEGQDGNERPARPIAWAWILGRGAAAVLSILMLLAGILLQGKGSPSSLAGRIAQVKTEFTQEPR